MTRILALCADDFGLSPGINAGIVRLARAQRLTAISCISNAPHWQTGAGLLVDLPDTVDVGLHLNFTEGRPLSSRLKQRWPELPSLKYLLLAAHLGRLPLADLRHEAHAQLSAFGRTHGMPPKFIDGHQHVHALPGLRNVILDMIEHVQPLPAVRSTAPLLGPGHGLKRHIIERSGGRALSRELDARVLAHNPALLGAYDFVETDYGALMRAWLAQIPPEGALLFCHPGGHFRGDPPDAISDARTRELEYLASDAFPADLQAADVRLGKVWLAPHTGPEPVTFNETSRPD